MSECIIIDNSPASYVFHPNNAVPISSWFNDPCVPQFRTRPRSNLTACRALQTRHRVDGPRAVPDGPRARRRRSRCARRRPIPAPRLNPISSPWTPADQDTTLTHFPVLFRSTITLRTTFASSTPKKRLRPTDTRSLPTPLQACALAPHPRSPVQFPIRHFLNL